MRAVACRTIISTFLLLVVGAACANPTGTMAVNGQVTINQSGNVLQINDFARGPGGFVPAALTPPRTSLVLE